MTWKTRQRERKADMPEVYIDSLTLENFGPFYGEHTLNLAAWMAGAAFWLAERTGRGKPIF